MTSRTQENKGLILITSDIVTITTTIELGGLDARSPHCFAGVQFFADAAGTMVAIPTAGTVVVTVQTVNSTPVFESVPSIQIDVANQQTLSWAANTQRVKAVPTGLNVATHYRLVVTCNDT